MKYNLADMLFTENLEDIIFNRHEIHDSDELVILSGYIGPRPVERLGALPFPTKVIYGMYGSDGIRSKLHQALCDTHMNHANVSIYYSKRGIHSKCYVWRNSGKVIHALVGSANFSTNGLTTPHREMLAESTKDTFYPLNKYLNTILNASLSCIDDSVAPITGKLSSIIKPTTSVSARMSLLDKYGEVPEKSGLNWGHADANVTPNDAYVAIRIPFLRQHPLIFPPKDIMHAYRLPKEPVELIWDDGMRMDGSLEGNNNVDGVMYPKQLTSKVKADIGAYIRQRIGVPSGQLVRRHHLDAYGRTDIEITLLGEGIYHIDFSV